MSLSEPTLPDTSQTARSDEAWLELAMRAADMGAWSWDLDADSFYVSSRAATILGVDPGVAKAHDGEAMVRNTQADDQPWVRETLLNAAQTGEPYKIEHRQIRPDTGAAIWVLSAGSALRDAQGRVTRLIGVLQDISARKQGEERRELLMAETDHRVKNVLASIQSMAMQSARRASSLEEFLKTFSGRLGAMASAHTLLTAARWRGADVGHIVGAELSSIDPRQAHWEGPEMALTPRATNALALALHELAVNAIKFGSLSREAGRVDVRWSRNAAGGIDLEWVESGGPPPQDTGRQGFGVVLLEKVTGRELGGEVRLELRPLGAWAKISSGPEAVISALPQPATVEAAPQAEPEASPVATRRAPAGGLNGLKVLLVEDSLLLAMELENGLTEAGAQVIGQASSVSEGMALAGIGVEAAVLDVDLNGESVRPVAEALLNLKIPFVFATGYDGKMAPQGFDAPIIRKPYDVTQVVAALAGLTGR